MRDRLIELIASKMCEKYEKDECASKWNCCCGECLHGRNFEIGDLADHLIANGVIVPPCKVGDTVWCIFEDNYGYEYVRERIVTGILIRDIGVFLCVGFCHYISSDIGKTVFLTREEAEKALAERSKNEN